MHHRTIKHVQSGMTSKKSYQGTEHTHLTKSVSRGKHITNMAHEQPCPRSRFDQNKTREQLCAPRHQPRTEAGIDVSSCFAQKWLEARVRDDSGRWARVSDKPERHVSRPRFGISQLAHHAWTFSSCDRKWTSFLQTLGAYNLKKPESSSCRTARTLSVAPSTEKCSVAIFHREFPKRGRQ